MSGTAYFFLCLALLVAGYAAYGLAAEKIFGVDLYEAGLANAVCEDLSGMLEGPGAYVRNVYQECFSTKEEI